MKAPSDERLMRYFDGELDADDAREVEAWLEGSPDGKLMLLGWERVGDAVRAIGDDVGGDDIADAVMARIDAAPKVATVHTLGRRGARRWIAAIPAIGLSIAAAAAVAIYLRPPASSSVAGRGAASVARGAAEQASSPSVESSSVVAVAAADTESGASIESVDFGAIGGSIFMVPSGQSSDESETPVVWLMDDAAPDEGRMAPL